MLASRLMQAGALGIAGVALAAQVVAAGDSTPPDLRPTRDVEPTVRPAVQPAEVDGLGPVVVRPLPPGHRRTSATAGSGGVTATQTITVSIQGGSLEVEPSSAVVDVVGGRASLPTVTVVDARGVLDGWTLCATFEQDGRRATRFRVVDAAVEDVYGAGAGLHPSHGASGRLLHATKGHGGGTYRFGGDVEFVGRARAVSGEIPVRFEVSGGNQRC